jgi:predicted nuclease with RNAse H fold
MIGATEEELKERGTPYEVGRARYENNARGQITGDLDGFVKLVFDPATRKLLGAHLIGGGATELVHIAQMVMLKDGGLDDFLHSVFNFPTLAECFKYAAYDGLQRLSHRQGGATLERTAGVAASNVEVHPPARAWFVGIDLIDPFAHTSRPVTLALMDRWRRVHFVTWTYDPAGDRMIPEEVAAEGFVVAIDGPQGLAARGRTMRQAERVLRAPGKSGETFARAGIPHAGLIRGSVELFGALRNSGLGLLGEAPWETTALLEVYPGDAWPKWAGRRPPKKSLPAGRRARYDILREHGLELPVGCDAVTHDQLDAAAAAFTAYLWATGNAREFGDPPVWDAEAGCIREGIIVSV